RLMAGSANEEAVSNTATSEKECYPDAAAIAEHVLQIRKDLPRTFPTHQEVADKNELIEEVLIQYAARDPEVGYCQGMNFPASVLVVAEQDLENASEHFQTLLLSVRGLWLPGFPLLEVGKHAFQVLFAERLPRLAAHFQDLSVADEMFLLDAWLTLFARWLPFGPSLSSAL
ncbi:unnamed protein product, partial [Polarella glacialis]